MSNPRNASLRQPEGLSLSFLSRDRILLIEAGRKRFYYPLNFSSFFYNPIEKKMWLVETKEKSKAFNGLSKILLAQAFLGVLLSYRRQLNIVGIGYQAHIEKENTKNQLVLKLGFSHQVRLMIPPYIEVFCPKPRVLVLKGISLQRVTNFAQAIRRCRLPSAYKEKGVYLAGETLRLKQGKKT